MSYLIRITTFYIVILSTGFFAFAGAIEKNDIKAQMDRYNIRWESQSNNSSESMPLGGGDVGCNVWVENGDVLVYLSRSGCFDENNQLLKLGRLRLRTEPNIFLNEKCSFSQELHLFDGFIQIKGKTEQDSIVLDLWVDVFNPVLNIDVQSSSAIEVTAFYESWRTEERPMPMNERSACFSYSWYPGDVTTYADVIESGKNKIQWYHRNRSDKLLFDFCVDQQGLNEVKDELTNTQLNLTFGGCLSGINMVKGESGQGKYLVTPFHYWSIKSEKPATKHSVQVRMNTSQAESVEEWKGELNAVDKFSDWQTTKNWWNTFWQRSYIFINTEKGEMDEGWQVGRNYQLFRYMLGCNAYGEYPTKFNGGLFTVDPQFLKPEGFMGTPDFREWGGGSHTAQNQRLVYWPMLKAGDFDMMKPQFDFYKRGLKANELRTEVYWGHEGCAFTEHPETFGLPAAATWGFDSGRRVRHEDTPRGTLVNPYVRLHYTNQLEFSFMILKYHEYSGADISEYLPFIKSSITFFVEHYKYLQKQRTGEPWDESGKLLIYPSTACETFKNIANPTDVSAAMIAVTQGLTKLPEKYISKQEKEKWLAVLPRIPDFSYDIVGGKKILVAGKDLPGNINTDIPELYPVFPYGFYGVGLPGLEVAVNTWENDKLASRKNFISWHQDAIFCARMGLTDEAKKITVLKMKDSGRRFPAFWGPGHDWVPDHNWGGSGMIGLQEMLVQTVNDSMYVLPAWPEEWDVDFKLHAEFESTVAGLFKKGVLKDLKIEGERFKNSFHVNEALKHGN